MSKRVDKAGANIRNLAFKRRIQVIQCFVGSAFLIVFPFLLATIVQDFLTSLTTRNSSSVKVSFSLAPIFYIAPSILALLSIANGLVLWKKADHASQGAKGEELVADELFQLEKQGWQIEYNLNLGKPLGDVDIFCISPQGQAFAIDVKSHKGCIETNGKNLTRRLGKKVYPFEKDFLTSVMNQALLIRQKKKLKFVTPVLAFANAQVNISSRKVRNVYVVDRTRLVAFLKSFAE